MSFVLFRRIPAYTLSRNRVVSSSSGSRIVDSSGNQILSISPSFTEPRFGISGHQAINIVLSGFSLILGIQALKMRMERDTILKDAKERVDDAQRRASAVETETCSLVSQLDRIYNELCKSEASETAQCTDFKLMIAKSSKYINEPMKDRTVETNMIQNNINETVSITGGDSTVTINNDSKRALV